MKTLEAIQAELAMEILERDQRNRNAFVLARHGQKVDSDDITRTYTELRCLKQALEVLKKGG
jgi:hypothetical protein